MDKEIYMHPIFYDLLNNFRYFFVGINMMAMPVFQKALIGAHKGGKSELEISVEYDDLKCIKDDIRDILGSFNKVVGLKLVDDKVEANIIGLMNFQARQVAVSMFDIIQFSKFQNDFANNKELFRFTKYIRHGAAHNNVFHFNADAKSELPVTWRNKTIKFEFHHKKKRVFDEFLTPADLVLLISDLSNLIKNK